MTKHIAEAVTKKIVLYKSYKVKAGPDKGKFPVRLRITYQQESKYFPVLLPDRSKLVMNETDFEQLDKKKFSHIKAATTSVYANAAAAIDKVTRDGRIFTWTNFEVEFLHQPSKKGFYKLFEDYLRDFERKGRAGTYLSYLNVLNVVKNFQKDKALRAEQITAIWLRDFEAYLLKPHEVSNGKGKGTRMSKCTPGGVGVYMRSLKAVYNFAISQSPDLSAYYPFNRDSIKGRYTPPAVGRGHKGGIFTKDQLVKFFEIHTDLYTPQWEAQQYFILSYLLHGLNFADICRIELQNIDLDKKTLTVIREKTKNTAPESRIIELNDELISIVRALTAVPWRMRSTVYLFPILQPGQTELQKKAVIHGFIKTTNKYLLELCQKANLPEVSTYAARHSAAVHAHRSGVPVSVIQKNLDHRNPATTYRYLEHWSPEESKAASNVLRDILFKSA